MKKYLLLILFLCGLAGCAAPVEKLPAPEKEGVVVALLDTGISTAAIDPERILPGYNYVLSSGDTEDRINHGTATGSVIVGCESAEVVGLAPEAFLVPLVVTDKVDGKAKGVTPEILAQAIVDAVDVYGADVINVSLGIKKDTEELRRAVEYAESKGVPVISAVGNDGVGGDPYYPAAYETVLGVGSHDKNNEISDFTQQNGTADLLAPGENIWLASRNGKTYGAKGSSYATAYVSATAARLLEAQPGLTAEEVRQALISSASTVDGWRILVPDAALGWISTAENGG